MSSQALIDAEAACDAANNIVWEKQSIFDSLMFNQDTTWVSVDAATPADKGQATAAYNSKRSEVIAALNDTLDARNTRAVLRAARDEVRRAGG